MSERYSGQLALVAGGTGGLGRAVALAFLEEGATVVVTYRNPNEFEALRDAAADHAPRLEGHCVDVTNDSAVHQMISSIIAKHGRLDAMTNSVGGYAAGLKLWETDPKVFDQMFALNFYSGYVLSILPSIIDTEANRKAMPQSDFSKWPKPQDIASVILFLCSDDAKLVHGASVRV